MSLHTRRRLLATIGVAGSAALAGCSTDGPGGRWSRTAETTTDPLSGEERGWSQFERTPGHAGFAPEVRVRRPHPCLVSPLRWWPVLPGRGRFPFDEN